MATKHTLGPWKLCGITSVGSGSGYYSVLDSDGMCVCDLSDRPVSDAHLISAAPDMYEALKGFVAKLDTAILVEGDHPTSHLADELRAALAALAKAEGRDNA